MVNVVSNTEVDWQGLVDAVRTILKKVGDKESILNTPDRYVDVLRGFVDNLAGREAVLKQDIVTFEEGCYDELIIMRDIAFYSLCRHHLLPFFGNVTVGYLPSERIVGLSKIPRVVHHFANQITLQEELCYRIGDFLWTTIRPRAVGVHIEARHFCMEMRGVEMRGLVTSTMALFGELRTNMGLKQEFLDYARK